jgi:EpsI family protein
MRNSAVSFAVTTGLLAGAILVTAMSERRIPEALALPLDRIDSRIAGWTEMDQRELDAESLKVLDPTTYLARTYRNGDSELDLFIAYFAEQRAGESMHSPRNCLPGAGWEILQRGTATLDVAGKQQVINKYVIENAGTRLLMLYWYQSRSRIVANEYMAKILLARDTALTGQTSGSIVRILAPDDTTATAKIMDFAAAITSEVQRCLGYRNAPAVTP